MPTHIALSTRRLLVGLVAFVLVTFAFVAPAAADAPGHFTDSSTFQEPDPCNPEVIQTTTLTFDVMVHDHRNVVVWVVDFTAETDTGYVGSGRDTIVMAANHFADTQTAIVSNEAGDRYKVNFHVHGTPNGVVTERFDIRCVVDA